MVMRKLARLLSAIIAKAIVEPKLERCEQIFAGLPRHVVGLNAGQLTALAKGHRTCNMQSHYAISNQYSAVVQPQNA